MKKELEELKKKMRECDLSIFKDYEEYIKYCNKLALDFMKLHKDLSIEELKKLLEEVK